MKKIFSKEAIRELDAIAISKYGILSSTLMENAGSFAAGIIMEKIADSLHPKVNIFVGKGNNGGDGFVIARYLLNNKINCSVFLTLDVEDLKGDSLNNYKIFKEAGGHIRSLTKDDDIKEHRREFIHGTVVVDALFGTGYKGKLSPFDKKVIEIMNKYGQLKVAVDIPSGLSGSFAVAEDDHFKADLTVTFGGYKLSSFLYPASYYHGDLYLSEIGIPKKAIDETLFPLYLLEAEDAKKRLPKRNRYNSKESFGHLLIIGGSKNFSGAVSLAALGGLRTGIGKVTIATVASESFKYPLISPEIMTCPLNEDQEGKISYDSLDQILKNIERYNVILLGPGLGISDQLKSLIKELITRIDLPMVIDADGLNNIKDEIDILASKKNIVITPHMNEMSRISSIPLDLIIKDPLSAIEKMIKKTKATILLKSASSIIASPNNISWINKGGNDALAKGGSGDILAGMIGSFIGQGSSTVDAALAASFYHLESANRYTKSGKGSRSMLPSDILDILPEIIND